MLTSITPSWFKSFGESEPVPLRPITVLVGPNNSGKSNLVSVGRFVRNVVEGDVDAAIAAEGGDSFVCYRPGMDRISFTQIGWESTEGSYGAFVHISGETLRHREYGDAWIDDGKQRRLTFGMPPEKSAQEGHERSRGPFSGLKAVMASTHPLAGSFRQILTPIIRSREIKLSLAALRQDAELVPEPRLGSDGSNLAAVLALWRGSDPDRAERLHEFVRRCLPEIRHIFVKPSPQPAYQRLWIQQTDGEQFDAGHVSDGVLFFIGLAMHAIEAAPDSLLFVEEPEQCIHPRRLGQIVELFRQIVEERGCQIVVVTHSPTLLDEFRDEPEAIVLFRRGEMGTRVKSLTELPQLMTALREKEAGPGEMLSNGFFDAPFR